MIQSLITGLFVISLLNSAKILNVGNYHFTYGLITMTLAFCLVDVVNQLQGKKEARQAVVNAVLTRLLLYPFALPIIGWRLILATELVSLLTQVLVDIPIFSKLKEIKMPFFVRTNLSNIISGSIGSALFVVIAFYGKRPNIETLVIGQIVMRFLLSLAFSPVTSIMVKIKQWQQQQ